MKYKVLLLTLVGALALCFTGCEELDEFEAEMEENEKTVDSKDSLWVYEYIDPDTGVHYLLYDDGNSGGMTIRYNADGTIMVGEKTETETEEADYDELLDDYEEEDDE